MIDCDLVMLHFFQGDSLQYFMPQLDRIGGQVNWLSVSLHGPGITVWWCVCLSPYLHEQESWNIYQAWQKPQVGVNL